MSDVTKAEQEFLDVLKKLYGKDGVSRIEQKALDFLKEEFDKAGQSSNGQAFVAIGKALEADAKAKIKALDKLDIEAFQSACKKYDLDYKTIFDPITKNPEILVVLDPEYGGDLKNSWKRQYESKKTTYGK